MGFVLKRVPLDLKFEMGQVWPGYINPHYPGDECQHCDGTGRSQQAKSLMDKWYGWVKPGSCILPFHPSDNGSVPFEESHPAIVSRARLNLVHRKCHDSSSLAFQAECRRLAEHFNSSWSHHLNQQNVDDLVARDRLYDLTHTFVMGQGWVKDDSKPTPTAAQVNEWSILGLGHDAINAYVVIEAECKRRGHPTTCDCCDGHGVVYASPEARDLRLNWKPSEPPTGDGYQIWENVSEGSPVSPVFETEEQLARWMSNNVHPQDCNYSYDTWVTFIDAGYAPSGAIIDGEYKPGIAIYE